MDRNQTWCVALKLSRPYSSEGFVTCVVGSINSLAFDELCVDNGSGVENPWRMDKWSGTCSYFKCLQSYVVKSETVVVNKRCAVEVRCGNVQMNSPIANVRKKSKPPPINVQKQHSV